jgi:hypothetical protein
MSFFFAGAEVSGNGIFIQTELLNLPVKEISRESGVPVNTLLSRKHYAVIHWTCSITRLVIC